MKLESYLLAFLVFSVIVVAGVLTISDVNHNYEGIIDNNISTSKFNSTYDTANTMYNLSQDQKDAVLGGEVSETNFVDSSYKGAYTAIRMISGSFGLIGGIINAIAIELSIPGYMVAFAMAAITIAIIFGIISLILRFK